MTLQQQTVNEAIAKLEELGGKLTAEEDIVFEGPKIILPEGTTLGENWRFLRQKEQEEEQNMRFHRIFNYRPWDGARATVNAIKKAFGAVIQSGTPGVFGDDPPEMISIPVSATETEQIPQGSLYVPHLPGAVFYLGMHRHREYGPLFELTAEGPRKFRFRIEGVFNHIDNELKTNSLYRGKAFDGQEEPEFINLSGVNLDKLVYTPQSKLDLESNLWSLLRYTQEMEEDGEELKRAVLLEGKYGSGKSMTAKATAKIATQNGWSFIMCRPGRDRLRDVMATARLYQPAVVFFEDVDVIADVESQNISELLDLFDGITAKDTKIICVLTTNHVERLHKGMCRPGRLDAIIAIEDYGPAEYRQLIEIIVPEEKRAENLDWDAIAKSLHGYVPAFCQEAIGRARRYNRTRNGGKLTKLETADFVGAANGLRKQLDRMDAADDKPSSKDPIATIIGKAVQDVVHGTEVVDSDGDKMYDLVASNGNGNGAY